MKKTRLLHLLALLLTAATGAWAQEPATTYSVKMKDGTQDAKNWTITSGEKSATGDAADGLTGLSEKDAVTLTYNGRMKVKGVKATSDAAPAEPSVPDGAINGKFSVSDGKQVYFAKGNLQAVCTSADNNPSDPETFTWQFAENQWDCVGNNAANNSIDGNGSVSAAGTVDLFGWSTAATTYGIHNSTTASDYSGDFVDWGETIGTGWRTLTKDEWNYLFMTRKSGSKVNGMSPSPDNARYTHATINTDNGTGGIRGMILFPDGVTVNYSDATYWGGINKYSNWNGSTKCTTSQWNALAAKGFVFLPTGGVRNGTTISNSNNNGYYWSSYTASPNSGYAHYTRVVASTEPTTASDSRKIGISVRLVYEVATTDAPATGNSVDLSTLTADYEAQNGDVLTGTLAGNYKISIADGATVTLDGVTINGVNDGSYEWAGITCLGDATIILSGTNTVKGFYEDYPGIQAAADKTLIINGTGSLTASSYGYATAIGGGSGVACGDIEIQGGTITATSGGLGAGIGGGYNASCGNITISGGTVIATGGNNSAGIGGGYNTSWGNITISGGTVTATGGQYGAGIGGGKRGPASFSCGNIIISGGTVTATGGDNAAGIGGGRGNNNKNFSSCGTITIANTVTKVTATKGENAPNSIGAGYYGNCGTVTIGGVEGAITTSPYTYDPAAPATTTLDNTTTAWTAGTFAVPAGGLTYSAAITVSGDVTLVLTDGTTLTLNKGISIASGATLTIQGNGTMNINGTNNSTASTVAGSTGTLILTSGTLTATGGNGGSVGEWRENSHGGAGGAAINGTVIVDGGTLTAKGGNGGSVGEWSEDSHGGAGGAAISGSLTINAGTVTTTNGAAGSVGDFCEGCSGGAAGKAVAGTVTDKR